MGKWLHMVSAYAALALLTQTLHRRWTGPVGVAVVRALTVVCAAGAAAIGLAWLAPGLAAVRTP